MFLSRIELNPRSRQVQAELNDPYQMHKTLSKAFGDDAARYRLARCLFRVEDTPDSGNPQILVQSTMRPDWDRLTVTGGYMKGMPQVKEFNPVFESGQRLAFRLKANPTVKRDGKRYGLYKEEERLAWLARKGEENGFQVLSVYAQPADKKVSHTRDGNSATFCSVTFNGQIKVTDPQLFLETLESGIGSGKGFGFGLLSVAAVR